MDKKKVFILLPDGIGLRNFAYSSFYGQAPQHGLDLVYWNMTPFPLSEMGYDEIRFASPKINPWTYPYKTARTFVELNLNARRSNDETYKRYKFKQPKPKNLKQFIKRGVMEYLVATHSSQKGWKRIRRKIADFEKNTDYYRQCLDTLRREKPEIVVCTNQRHALTIAPILAAKELGIPTAAFIFSWDNLPKATMVLDTDHYFVWSELMKEQLLYYYPEVKPDQIIITGSPQFEPHFNASLLMPRGEFCRKYGLDPNKRYICFSGDDVTTSPDDPLYLRDVAIAVRSLNSQGRNIGILFRRCPVDFSGRYDKIIKEYGDVITEISPRWKKFDFAWHTIFPEAEDAEVFANLINNTEMVINLGSSMVFDYAAFNKPCAYFKYNQPVQSNPNWDIHRVYNYIHFRSMPSPEAVLWIDNPEGFAPAIESVLDGKADTVGHAQQWFEKINRHPAGEASRRILEAIGEIIKA